MTMDQKANLINQLNMAVGNTSLETKQFENKYDESTGTFYCGGMKITLSTIERAKEYFHKLMLQCNNSEVKEIRDVGIYYRLAIEAINHLQKGGEQI